MTVWTDSLGLVTLGRQVIKNKKCLLEEVEMLQKTATNENVFREGFEKELAQLRRSVARPTR